MVHKFNRIYVGKKRAISNFRDESTQDFINMLKGEKYQPLNLDEELNLVYRAKEGDKKAVNELVEHNLMFVVSVAKEYKFEKCALSISDLVNEGVIGFIECIETYDPTIGVKLISHAVFSIRGAITAALSQKSRVVRSKSHNISVPIQSTSLDAPMTDDSDTTLGDVLCVSNDAESFIKESLVNDLMRVINNVCKPVEASVLCAIYGVGTTQLTRGEVAEKLDITEERVRQIYESAKFKIRNSKQALSLLAKYLG